MKDQSYKLTKAQAVAAFLEEERAEELDIITAAMTKEQHVAAIEAAGISREAQHALFEKQNQKLREILSKLPAPENVVPIRKDVPVTPKPQPKRRFFTVRDAKVGSLFASVAAAATFVIQQATVVAPVAAPYLATAAATPPAPPADALRDRAYAACGRGRWEQCLTLLDRAKEIDPDGDVSEDAQNARQMAAERRLRR